MPPVRLTYRQIAADITERIAAGEYLPGEKLPSYRQLAAMYSVSIATAQRTYILLTERGIAVGQPGVAMYVADPPPESGNRQRTVEP